MPQDPHRPRLACALALLLSVPVAARAATVTVSVDPVAGSQLASQLGITTDQLSAQLAQQIQSALVTLNPEAYVRALADAQAFSNKGLGVDYASNPSLFVIGAAGNFAVSLGDKGLGEAYSQHPVMGLAPNVSIHGGLNLGFLGLDSLTLFGNYFTRGLSIKEYDGDLSNYGVHLQLKLFAAPNDGSFLFKWGGLNVTSGFEYSHLTVRLQRPLSTTVLLSGSAGSTNATFDGNGTLTVDTTAQTIPIELTTNIRLLYVLSLFAGAGFDIQLGSGDMDVNLSGNLSAPSPNGGDKLALGQAKVTVTQPAQPSPSQIRLLAGVQLNLSVVKIFVQANASPNSSFSGGGGVRVAW
jgi:hypothetical protein